MEQDINRHHIWFNRKNFYTPSDKKLRNLGGFALDIYAPAHRLLHAQMKPMVKPTRWIADMIIDFAESVHQDTRFDVLEQTAGMLISEPFYTYDENMRAARLGHHLLKQRDYFDLHPLSIDK